MQRCEWASGNETEKLYHDSEWGVPIYDNRLLFEFLCLEGAQAGLSWSTILNKRANYQKAFDNFDARKIVQYDDEKINTLLQDKGIVRNRLKILSAINNAKIFLDIQEKEGSFSQYIWHFIDEKVIQNNFQSMKEVPASTAISEKMSRALKKEVLSL